MGKNFMGYSNASELITAIGNKIKAKYTKPSGGIPKTDLASGVQTSLGKADSAVQPSSLVDVVDNGAKNSLVNTNRYNNSVCVFTGITYTLNDDDSVTVSGSNSTDSRTVYSITSGSYSEKAGHYTVNNHVDEIFSIGDVVSDSSCYAIIFYSNDGKTWATEQNVMGTSDVKVTIRNYPYYNICICVAPNTTLTNPVTFYPMICTKEQYDISPEHEPHALGNQYLTPALIEQVDSGSKNQWDPSKVVKTHTHNGVTFTLSSDGVVTANGKATGADAVFGDIGSGAYKANKILYIEGSINSGLATWFFDIYDAGWQNREICHSGTKVVYKESKSTTAIWRLIVPKEATCDNVTFKPMVCDLVDWKMSHKYAPHRPDWDAISSILEYSLKPWALLKSGDNLDNIPSTMESKGLYFMFATCTNDVLNKPADGIFMVLTYNLGGGSCVQEATILTGSNRGKVYSRTYINSNDWSGWVQISNV